MTTKLYDPAILVNNKSVLVNPNTIKTDDGLGETKVDVGTRGAGNLEIVTSQDVSTLKGMVEFEMPLTIENVNVVKGWQRNLGANFIELTASADGKTLTEYCPKASVTKAVKKEFGADGKLAIEFTGAQFE